MIKNIVFDVGDVLIEYRWQDMLTEYGLSIETAEEVGQSMFGDPLWAKLDIGNESLEEILQQYEKKYPDFAVYMRWFLENANQMMVARPEVWKRVHALKEKGYKIYLLSNYCKELFQIHTKGATFLNDIDGKVVSYQIHKIKPDEAIYQHLLSTYQLEPEECLFFDDRADNTRAAEKLGFSICTVISQEQLINELDLLLSEE